MALRPLTLSLLLCCVAHPMYAAILGPYTSDANTIHLFHLDEAASTSSAANSVSGGSSLISFNGTSAVGTNNAAQPTITTLLGTAGASGFGNAANISSASVGLGLDANNSGGFQPGNSTTNPPDAILHSSLTGTDGSFTLEALVNIPDITTKREIICSDSSLTNRGFQFYTNTDGTICFNFISTNASSIGSAAIPLTGTNAFVANAWFHVAYAYDGTANTAKFFWTRLINTNTQANELTANNVEATSGSIYGPLVIGNEGRSASSEGLRGLIDEVRISKIARTANQFLFITDDSDNDGLSDTWENLYFNNLSQTGNSDPDGDGYDNEAEETAGTNPTLAASNPSDTDADGLPDAWEISNFTNTTSQNATGDPDADYATNLLEYNASTNPTNTLSFPDTDSDGMNDGWEIQYFSNLSHNGTTDTDSDGFTDLQEHNANSDPNNPLWTPQAAVLAHRWSFNGAMTDSVGGVTATIVDPDGNAGVGGTATLGTSDIALTGGTSTTSAYVKLGAGGLLGGRRTPVTIELWASQTAVLNWSRIFDFGSSTSEYLFMSWSRGTTASQDRVSWVDAVSSTADETIAPYGTNTPWHIVMTIAPRAGASGTTRVSWRAAPASASSLGAVKGTFDTANTLWNLNDSLCYLGRSQWSADNTANARFNEFRIWDGIVPATTLESQHLIGPDSITVVDTDQDGLPDAWEMQYFGNLTQSATDDPDGDLYSNLTEFNALSNPTVTASTPLDLDADGLNDNWEIQYFGNTSAPPNADPDGDGENNLTEQTQQSAPTNKASNSTDIDADSLPDAWELTYFPNLSSNGGDDPDGDGFGNLQEYQAGTNPTNAASRPAGIAVRLVPLDDDNNATSEFGYAGSSAINSVAFVRSSVKTVGNQQFITWYGRHQYDATAAYNNTIWIGRRTLGSSHWQVFRHPTFTANTITDGHDVICYGIDGEGYMHVSWGMHGDAFHYSKSTTPVTGTGTIALGPDTTMTGMENSVTYPQFLKLPGGDVLFIFREGVSGDGDVYINRYALSSHTWSNVHGSASAQSPLFKGTGWTPNYNAYLNLPQLGGVDGDDLILTWCWRYSSGTSDSGSGAVGYQTNNNLNFARSADAGLTWKRFNGTSYVLPINRDAENGNNASKAEVIQTIAENSSLINQASTCLDANDNPVTCTWWAPDASASNQRRQYRVVFRDDNGTSDPADDSWQARTIATRTTDPTGTRYAENHVRDLGRPIVVTDDSDRIIVAYRDNQASNLSNTDNSLSTGVTNGLSIVHSLPKAEDPHRLLWVQFDLTAENLGNYEPIIDNELWDRDRQLHFLYQAAEGQGYTSPANLASRFSILEWDAASYFAHNPQPQISFNANQSQVSITSPSQPSWSYRLWTSTNLIDWQIVETRSGTGSPIVFTQPYNAADPKRFWRLEYSEGGF